MYLEKMKLMETSWKVPRKGMGTEMVFHDCEPRVKKSHDQSNGVAAGSIQAW